VDINIGVLFFSYLKKLLLALGLCTSTLSAKTVLEPRLQTAETVDGIDLDVFKKVIAWQRIKGG
jgi:hypothetical protein